jgi:hypothetical protein
MKNNLRIGSRRHKLKVQGLIRMNYKIESQFDKKLEELISLWT